MSFYIPFIKYNGTRESYYALGKRVIARNEINNAPLRVKLSKTLYTDIASVYQPVKLVPKGAKI
jgi:hypothetical protein